MWNHGAKRAISYFKITVILINGFISGYLKPAFQLKRCVKCVIVIDVVRKGRNCKASLYPLRLSFL